MLLVIDVGNTNTVIGAMVEGEVSFRWRISTKSRTTDELGMLLVDLLQFEDLEPSHFHGVCVSCVVPSVLYAIEKASRRYFELDALVIGKGIRTGMKVRTDNPREVGSDRIVNAVAAFHSNQKPMVVIDFGTATTLDCVNSRGDYLGGAIAPGFQISAEALFSKTAKLPKVEVDRTESVIGKNTIHSMQAGLFWGYVGLVDGLAARCKAELQVIEKTDESISCIATGGLANLVGQACTEIHSVDNYLTLRGLWILFELNQ